MKKSTISALAALALLIGFQPISFAGSEDIIVENAWARASIGTQRPSVAYMTLRNNGTDPVTLTGLKTPLAMMAEVHNTTTDKDGVSSMAPTGNLIIEPGKSVSLAPSGLHAMLMKLQKPMVEGESFSLTLIFADGKVLDIDVPILSIAARGPVN